MSASDNLSGEQFKHTWKKGEDDLGLPATVSETPIGKYTITKGAGRLKWAVSHEDGWEVLGTTKKEVMAEAENHLQRRAPK